MFSTWHPDGRLKRGGGFMRCNCNVSVIQCNRPKVFSWFKFISNQCFICNNMSVIIVKSVLINAANFI